MDSLYQLFLSPPGRVLLLSLIVGIATQGIKTTTPKETWARASLPAVPVLIGALCGLFPGVLIGEATVLMGAGAGALSGVAVQLYERYKEQKLGLTNKGD